MLAFYFQLLLALARRCLAWVRPRFTVTSGLQYIVQGLKQLETPTSVSGRV